jgi:hypothetical protein
MMPHPLVVSNGTQHILYYIYSILCVCVCVCVCARAFVKMWAIKQSVNSDSGRDIGVVTATRYGLDGSVFEPLCRRNFPHPSW